MAAGAAAAPPPPPSGGAWCESCGDLRRRMARAIAQAASLRELGALREEVAGLEARLAERDAVCSLQEEQLERLQAQAAAAPPHGQRQAPPPEPHGRAGSAVFQPDHGARGGAGFGCAAARPAALGRRRAPGLPPPHLEQQARQHQPQQLLQRHDVGKKEATISKIKSHRDSLLQKIEDMQDVVIDIEEQLQKEEGELEELKRANDLAPAAPQELLNPLTELFSSLEQLVPNIPNEQARAVLQHQFAKDVVRRELGVEEMKEYVKLEVILQEQCQEEQMHAWKDVSGTCKPLHIREHEFTLQGFRRQLLMALKSWVGRLLRYKDFDKQELALLALQVKAHLKEQDARSELELCHIKGNAWADHAAKQAAWGNNMSCTDLKAFKPYGRTSALRAYSQPADGWSESEDDAADGQDEQASLNGLLESALEAPGDAHGQQRELVALQRFLKGGPMALSAWSGPGTPLGAAVRSGRSDVARMLLKAHADPNEKDPKGVSALHLAAFDGSVDLCKVILFAHAHVDQRDRHGQTPLFFAPSAAVCKVLIESNSDVRVLNRKGQSALHLAGRAGLCEVLEWLGSRVSRSLFELKDLHGATASDYLEQSGAVPKPAAAEGPERGQPQSQRPPSPPASPRRASPALRGRAEGLPQALAEDEAQARRPAAPKASSQAPRITVISAAKESSAVPSAPRSWSQSGQWLAPPSARRSRGSYSGPKCIVDERRHSGAAAPAPAAPPAVQAPAVHAPGPRILDLRQDPHRSSRGSIGGHDPGRQEAAGERRSFSLFNVGGRAPPPRQMPPGAGGRAAGGQAEDLALEAAAALATAAVTAAAAGMQAVSMQEAAASAIAPQAADEDFDNDADHWPVQVMDSTARHQLEQAKPAAESK
ncbi:unnamed protein product [Prorocentrum cordatum]|uniref:Uncharacterized protein n=1 Tax=Prorocentrum cordatum TaxID=2364126 RepID=A0ABN9UCS8_9DINO|nr:unnamed protein product [Polarella glacialis]